MYPIVTQCTGIPPTSQFISSRNAPLAAQTTLPANTPIIIIYAGQQPPANGLPHVDGKIFIQGANGQVLNENSILQAISQKQGFPLVSGAGGLPIQTQIVLQPPSSTNTIPSPSHQHKFSIQQQQQQHPSLISSNQTMFQTLPTMINLERATMIQPNHTSSTALFSQHPSLAHGGMTRPVGKTSMAYTTAPPQILTTATNTVRTFSKFPPDLPKKKINKSAPISISPDFISSEKRNPPPLLQVKHEDKEAVSSSASITSQAGYVTQNGSHFVSQQQVSPKTTFFPLPLIPEAKQSLINAATQSVSIQASPAVSTSLPYIFLDGKQKNSTGLVQPPNSHVFTGNGMPIYRFSSLNNIQPLQILTPLPAQSAVTLPDFMKHNSTVAH